MSTPILRTKLYIPPPRPNFVSRQRLIDRLHAGLPGKLTLISAPAGFGKTTLVGEWIAASLAARKQPTAWLSLDAGDHDPIRFLAYLVAALEMIAPDVGRRVSGLLQSPQPPSIESILTTLLNDIAIIPDDFVLVLDDYHVVDASAVDQVLTFLLEHLPPQMHLVITTREDPSLPLARYRARGHLTEIRAGDLRFTEAEAAAFLNQVMGLNLSAAEIAALENRTEGWIAGLQLAAVSMQGNQDAASFIKSFTGSHRFVMDYLLEEVLHQQPPAIQTFLLRTAILDRLTGSLCDALMQDAALSGQRTLELLEQANLFIIPLDNERRWYRYHHLFAELLQQRLQQSITAAQGNDIDDGATITIAELHMRASQWYEENDLELEAFHHATLAGDIARAERLIEGKGMPLHFRGAIIPVLSWLDTLPTTVLDAHPSLWLALGSTLLATGQVDRTNKVLRAAETLFQQKEAHAELDASDRDLIGRIAAIRATIAAGFQQREAIIEQSERALRYLDPDNVAFRTSTNWKLGYAYQLGGDFAMAKDAYQEAIIRSKASGNIIFNIMSHIGLADIYQTEAQLALAADYYRRAIELYGEQPLPSAGEAYSGLAQIYYEWNDLDAAYDYAEQGVQLGRQWEKSDSPIRSEWIVARVWLARGEIAKAAAQLAQTMTYMQQSNFVRHLDDIIETQVLLLLMEGNLAQATALTTSRDLPLSQVRIHIAKEEIACALTLLQSTQMATTTKGRLDKMLRAMVLQVVALQAGDQHERALQLLAKTLAKAETGGWVRLFVDEQASLAPLVKKLAPTAASYGISADYLRKLLSAFADAQQRHRGQAAPATSASEQPLPEPLSEREIEVLQLIAAGHKNQEIADTLIVSLNTVRYHTKNLYGKLGVNKRTQAVAKAQELGLL